MAVGGASDQGLRPNGSGAYFAAGFRVSPGSLVPGPIDAWPLKVNFQSALRAANAVATAAFGLLGLLVGLMAFGAVTEGA